MTVEALVRSAEGFDRTQPRASPEASRAKVATYARILAQDRLRDGDDEHRYSYAIALRVRQSLLETEHLLRYNRAEARRGKRAEGLGLTPVCGCLASLQGAVGALPPAWSFGGEDDERSV